MTRTIKSCYVDDDFYGETCRTSVCDEHRIHWCSYMSERHYLERYLYKTRLKYTKRLQWKLDEIYENLVPIKYFYEKTNNRNGIRGVGRDDYDRLKIVKIDGRYYCCKNRVDCYLKWKDNKKNALKKKEDKFMKEWRGGDIRKLGFLPPDEEKQARKHNKKAIKEWDIFIERERNKRD